MSPDLGLHEGPIVLNPAAVGSWLQRARAALSIPPFARRDRAETRFNDFDDEGNPVTVIVTIQRGWDRS